MESTTALAYLIQGAALGVSAAASPGPLQTYLISQSLSGGFRSGAPVAFAPLITDLPIILFSLFVLNQMPPYFLRLISIAGGLFVFYLAWGIWRNWRSGQITANSSSDSAAGSLGRGVLANFLSPGPYLFWGLVNGPILVSALQQSTGDGVAFLLGFYGVFISGMLLIALFFSQARRLGTGLVRGLLLASAIILVVFGALLLKRGIWG